MIWARRGDNEVIRVFATPRGERVALRTLAERRQDRDEERSDRGRHGDNGRHRGWVRHDPPPEVITDIGGRLRARAH